MSNNQNKPQELPQVNARMENEPQEIYLVCYDLSETNKDYLPEDNDFDSLDGENVLWSSNDIAGMGTIKYFHHAKVAELEAEYAKLKEALETINLCSDRVPLRAIRAIVQQALNSKEG